MTEKLVCKLVNSFVEYQFIQEQSREEYCYRMLCTLETVITVCSMFLIALFWGNVIEGMFFCAFFFGLRSRTGGFHLQSFRKCYVCSLLVYIAVLACGEISTQISSKLIWPVIGIAAWIICAIGTVNHSGWNLDREELKASKRCARYIVIIEAVTLCFMGWLHIEKSIIVCSGMGMVVCAALLLVARIAARGK